MTTSKPGNTEPESQHGRLSLPEAWVVRGEKQGADEEFNIRACVASMHWNDFPNPFTHGIADLKAHATTHPGSGGPNTPRQIWDFAHNIPIGALIVMPRLHPAHDREVAIGWCQGPAYPVLCPSDNEPNLRLPVEWVATDLQRAEFNEITQQRFNSPRDTVSRVSKPEVVSEIMRRLSHEEVADEAR